MDIQGNTADADAAADVPVYRIHYGCSALADGSANSTSTSNRSSGGGMNKTAVTFTASNSTNSDDTSDCTNTDGDSSVINNPLVTNHP